MAERTEKVAESIARRILQDIRARNLKPGAMLPAESVMIEEFEVGRSSLREALRILEVNGLVTLKPGPKGGPIVAAPSPTNFGRMMTLHLEAIGATYRELLDARVEYEVVLARLAAEQFEPAAGGSVRDALAAEVVPSDDHRYAGATADFHQAVGTASGNPAIALVSHAIYAIWSVRVARVLYPPDERETVLREHVQIGRAIERNDARKAERLMRDHMLAYREFCEQRYPARMDDLVDWS